MPRVPTMKTFAIRRPDSNSPRVAAADEVRRDPREPRCGAHHVPRGAREAPLLEQRGPGDELAFAHAPNATREPARRTGLAVYAREVRVEVAYLHPGCAVPEQEEVVVAVPQRGKPETSRASDHETGRRDGVVERE